MFKDVKRQQLADAAEKRRRKQESRGVKDPDALRRKQQKREQQDTQRSESAGSGLKVSRC